jgi:hypothetical protein
LYPDGSVDTQEWYRDGKQHRDADLPAVLTFFSNGTISVQEWYRIGKLHRDAGQPARVWYRKCGAERTSEWWVDGQRHRGDGKHAVVLHANPTVEEGKGVGEVKVTVPEPGTGTETATKLEWWERGQRHRDGDLPAITNSNGRMEWWVRHRRQRGAEGMPHVIESDGSRLFYAVHNSRDVMVHRVLHDGTQEWFHPSHGGRHRDGDLPAVIFPSGKRVWCISGVRHRDGDAPAIVYPDGRSEWYKDGLLHREGDQPAVDGGSSKMWYRHGWIHRDGDQPAVVSVDGTQKWYKKGLLHRDGDLPAVVSSDGTQKWYKHGLRHRDGPLPAILNDGLRVKKYFRRGVRLFWITSDVFEPQPAPGNDDRDIRSSKRRRADFGSDFESNVVVDDDAAIKQFTVEDFMRNFRTKFERCKSKSSSAPDKKAFARLVTNPADARPTRAPMCFLQDRMETQLLSFWRAAKDVLIKEFYPEWDGQEPAPLALKTSVCIRNAPYFHGVCRRHTSAGAC